MTEPTITYRAGWWRIYGIDANETPCFHTREEAETYARSHK